MPAIAATAPGKIILFGEHAVVYNRPAIAVPVTQVRAKAVATANLLGTAGQVQITAKDIGLDKSLDALPHDHPLALAVHLVAKQLKIERLPALRLSVTSTIPIASGLGSGAAVSAAITRALSAFLGHPLSDEQVSQVAYRVDQIHHGAPSGIDNTTIAYAQPIFFIREQPFERLQVGRDFTMVIGNTGISSPTSAAVGDVRKAWQAAPERYEAIFDEIGEIALQARQSIENGSIKEIGPLMTHNHRLLQMMDVSCPELDQLVQAAQAAGALGAKLCGGGRGGNMIALVEEETAQPVADALRLAGAVNTIITTVRKT